MALKPEKIVRIRIIGANSKRSLVVSALHDAGVMQLEDVSGDIAGLMEKGTASRSYEKLSSELLRFRGMEAILPRRQAERKYFKSLEELLEAASQVNIEPELKQLKERDAAISTELREIGEKIRIAEALAPAGQDLSIYSGRLILSFLAKKQEGSDIRSSVIGSIPDAVCADLHNNYFLVSVPAGKDSDLARLSNERGFLIVAVPQMSGRPDAFIEESRSSITKLQGELADIRTRLVELSEKWFAPVAQIREQLEIESRKFEVSEKLASTRDSFALEGWLPARYHKMLVDMLENITGGNVIVSVVKTEEQPPTLLKNPRGVKLFEFFIRFYSLPQEYEVDPTLVFALVFPFFFGIMVGDWGYGLAILLISLFIIHRIDHPVRKSHIPKMLSGFVLMIMGPSALRTLAKALIPSSIIAIVAGLLFNEFFGFSVLPVTVLDMGLAGSSLSLVTSSTVFDAGVGKLLLFTGYFGLSLVSLGLVLGAYNEYTKGHRRGIAGKIGWLLFAWGISMLGLGLIHHASITGSVSGLASIAMLVAGVVTIFASEGTMGAMELPSIISHILSYTRIVGILLASVILAEVIDIIFLKGVAKSPLLAVVGVVILVVGQLFNLIIAVFEPGIQGARLIYVEFFSKFYKGNGKYFRPFSSPRNYTVKQFDLEGNGPGNE